jgi:hypothetical protein
VTGHQPIPSPSVKCGVSSPPTTGKCSVPATSLCITTDPALTESMLIGRSPHSIRERGEVYESVGVSQVRKTHQQGMCWTSPRVSARGAILRERPVGSSWRTTGILSRDATNGRPLARMAVCPPMPCAGRQRRSALITALTLLGLYAYKDGPSVSVTSGLSCVRRSSMPLWPTAT